MTIKAGENKPRDRDYKHEYELRRKRTKRLHADMERAKVEAFQRRLEARGITFISWLEIQIDIELRKDL